MTLINSKHHSRDCHVAIEELLPVLLRRDVSLTILRDAGITCRDRFLVIETPTKYDSIFADASLCCPGCTPGHAIATLLGIEEPIGVDSWQFKIVYELEHNQSGGPDNEKFDQEMKHMVECRQTQNRCMCPCGCEKRFDFYAARRLQQVCNDCFSKLHRREEIAHGKTT